MIRRIIRRRRDRAFSRYAYSELMAKALMEGPLGGGPIAEHADARAQRDLGRFVRWDRLSKRRQLTWVETGLLIGAIISIIAIAALA